MLTKTNILCTLLICGIATLLFAQSGSSTIPEPNYQQVFPKGEINTIKVKISPEDWESMQEDMVSHFGDFGSGNRFAGERSDSPSQPRSRNFPPPPPMGMQPDLTIGKPRASKDFDPDYIAVDIDFNGKLMEEVGFRLKGNSSLSNSWLAGTYKLPFRLNFKKYEKQSLYGFQELSFSPAFKDPSLIREKIAYDLFREAGVPSPQTSFCKVFIDFGEGSQYYGLYTLIEVVDDTMIKSQFGTDQGNIYKPESTFSDFAPKDFEKKNNKQSADWKDVETTIDILNHSIRKSDPALWRKKLESVFNMDVFMRWLAMNTLLSSWDSYGNVPHNYYLYHAPDQKLTWIPWDQNEVMNISNKEQKAEKALSEDNPDHSVRPNGPRTRPMLSQEGIDLTLKTVGKPWSLITAVAEDPVYYALYIKYVKQFSSTYFSPERMDTIIDQRSQLIEQAVAQERSPFTQLSSYQSFLQEIDALKLHVRQRVQATEILTSSSSH
ncbi:CotH kinase family protein [Dyadobacter tibetensis]|uniref:CotH kinase family protein n=1 Tax=Dyadobacter tibetensis TaxID=1211851 RepID=UPI00046F6A4A|nr:CotH kinase family protein [Dyadobacter tibetensis]